MELAKLYNKRQDTSTQYKLIVIVLLLLSSSSIFGQTKFQYLKVEFYTIIEKNELMYNIDTSGMREELTIIIKSSLKDKKFKSENELLNVLGNLGWEIYLIEDYPNKISQSIGYNGSLINGEYNMFRDWHNASRKIYFKMKID